MTSSFIHLRARTAYSLLEGANKIDALTQRAVNYKMPAVGITDAGNLFGALEYTKALSSAGIQPIIGATFRIMHDAKEPLVLPHKDLSTLALFAQNEQGYLNLLKLSSDMFLKDDQTAGFYKPHLIIDDLENHHEGLILLSGGFEGFINTLLLQDRINEAEEWCTRLSTLFKNRFYIELDRYGLPREKETEDHLVRMAYAQNLPLVATNHAYFLDKDMFEAHDVLLAVSDSTTVFNDERRHLTPHHYFKSEADMAELFSDIPEALQNTLIIAKRCAYMSPSRAPIFPDFKVREGFTQEDELRAIARDGLQERLAKDTWKGAPHEDYLKRLDYELDIIIQMGFAGYFLIVADFILWAKTNHIPVGPGRGSGAGSVVAWSLMITDLDPLRFGLLFERFLNPERVSMPDFDIDFCQERRDEVIAYVQQKYGADRVAHIITFGKLQARAVLRDVGRALGMPYGQVDRICKLVPNNPAAPVTLEEAIEGDVQLQAMRDDDETVKRLLDIGMQLEGLYRHASTHAAGLVIGNRPLHELVPLYQDQRSQLPATQFNMKYVETAGLIKFDFLGLKTLSVIEEAVRLIENQTGTRLDISLIPLDDPQTFELLQSADTVGVFQVEGAGMRDVLKKMKPTRFEDLIALVSLYRPGPMENIPAYVARKHGLEEAAYLHPMLEEILAETHGIMIYQEQVMQAGQKLGGYSLGGADLLRRAMGKKIKAEMDAQQKLFVDGALKNNIDEKIAVEIFEQMAKFAGYGFNKSHAAAYALIMYQTAYLKANYPHEFFAASLSFELDNTDKIYIFKEDIEHFNIKLLTPCMQHSFEKFSVEKQGNEKSVRYALGAVKNVGVGAMGDLVKERTENGPFQSLTDFLKRADPKALNKRMLEKLIAAGAFDVLHANRHELFENIELLSVENQNFVSAAKLAQTSLFGGEGDKNHSIKLKPHKPWNSMETLEKEFGALGFYLTAHPLELYKSLEAILNITPSTKIADYKGTRITLAGIISDYKVRTSAKGKKFSFIRASDASGSYEFVAFSELLAAAKDVLDSKEPLLITAEIRKKDDDTLSLTGHNVERLENRLKDLPVNFTFLVKSREELIVLKQEIDALKPGMARFHITLDTEGHLVHIPLNKTYALSGHFLSKVKGMLRG